LAVAARSVTQMVQKHARAQRRPDAAWTQCTPALAHQAAWAVGALSLGPPRTRVKTARAEDIGKNGPVLSVPLTAPAVGWSSTATATPGSIVWHWGNTACLRPRSSRIYPGELSQVLLRFIVLLLVALPVTRRGRSSIPQSAGEYRAGVFDLIVS